MAAKQDFQHLSRLFYQLEQIKPEGNFTKPIHYKELYSGSQKRELLIFVTDLYQQNEEIFQLLDTLNTLKHEVVVFHLMARNELELDFKGYSSFEDLETGETLQIDQSTARKTYQENLNIHLENMRVKLLDKNIFYRMICTDEPLDVALRDFLKQREKVR
jgi:hypothetical protein